jgi:hypothetical protein
MVISYIYSTCFRLKLMFYEHQQWTTEEGMCDVNEFASTRTWDQRPSTSLSVKPTLCLGLSTSRSASSSGKSDTVVMAGGAPRPFIVAREGHARPRKREIADGNGLNAIEGRVA